MNRYASFDAVKIVLFLPGTGTPWLPSAFSTPCGPGFLDSRDAILLADAIIYNNAHRCLIWQAFARRGMGFNASQGSPNVATDQTEGFNLPPYCLPDDVTAKLLLNPY